MTVHAPLKKTRKPYVLKMGKKQRVVGFYKSHHDAIVDSFNVNKSRLRSEGPEHVEAVYIIYDQAGEEPRCVEHRSAEEVIDRLSWEQPA